MTLLNHIGLLILFILICEVIFFWGEIFGDSDLEGFEIIYFPVLTGVFVWMIFEAFYWTIKIFF